MKRPAIGWAFAIIILVFTLLASALVYYVLNVLMKMM